MKEGKPFAQMLVSFICVVEHTCARDERWVPIGMYSDYLIWDADDPVDSERGFGCLTS